jgi:hypothetical protein
MKAHSMTPMKAMVCMHPEMGINLGPKKTVASSNSIGEGVEGVRTGVFKVFRKVVVSGWMTIAICPRNGS